MYYKLQYTTIYLFTRSHSLNFYLQLMIALKRFNRSVATKKKRNLVAHFCEMHISNLLSKKMYKRWMETYCALSSCEQGNDSHITVDWLKRSANCLRFRLKCAESAFYMRQ